MSRVEEELRAAFARHEALTPAVGPVRDRIDFAWVRVRRRRAKRRVIGAAAAVLLAGAALPVVSASWRHGGQPEVSDAAVLSGQSAAAAPVTGPVDVLLIGSDRRVGSATALADTVMLLHVPADRGAAWMVSFPRDGLVTIPGRGTIRLNASLALGGPDLVAKTVTTLTGVKPDATVTVDFTALRAVTEAVGGVRMCLEQAIPAGFGRRGFAAGCQPIDGDDVTALLRARYGLERGAYDRDRINQQFLRALADRVTAGGAVPDASTMQRLLAQAKDGIRVDGDMTRLLQVVEALGSPRLAGISEQTFHSQVTDDHWQGERIYPTVGKELYQAIRDDKLAAWAAANPDYVSR
ncbi:LCP family protein [Actinoplanes teichomyceticus]|uniref:LytR family transcriptional attenuator n=1 Tax=Actinoplanes teichomyceticus TaxID=1867 RepID=A0A561WRT0_ACTTI|nr:LCP family protein [Actinoplanes teichomyceticus]TWG26553.1 LytR family transcriptional attenuator [Actinoplanes teichomyceticus]GIF11629.1 hypothetical protein Ate01nite_16610 [Actinoplanes teichomyceticus]